MLLFQVSLAKPCSKHIHSQSGEDHTGETSSDLLLYNLEFTTLDIQHIGRLITSLILVG